MSTPFEVEGPSIEAIAADIRRVASQLNVNPCHLRRRDYRESSRMYNDRDFVLYGGWGKIMRTFFPDKKDQPAILAMDDVRKHQIKLDRKIGYVDTFLDSLDKSLKKFPAVKIKQYKKKKSKLKIKRSLSVVISDIHIGSDLTEEETGNRYGILEEARTIGHITRTVIGYKEKYREETELHVFLDGDIIQNILHGPSTADLLQMQICRAIWLLTHMLSQFAIYFPKVYVHCATGNHDRDIAFAPKKATSLKFNSHATTIYYACKVATRHFKHIEWDIPKTPWTDTTILGHRVRATHGDSHLNIGNPGKSLNVGAIENMTNKINASLKDKDEFKIFIVGHTHSPFVTRLNNKSFLIVNGAGQTPDPFANTMNIVESCQIQVMFETTEEHAVGDFRFIDMTGQMKDESLDKLIPPWPGLNK